jgi:peptide subunit release factor 1 (eRF1)
VAGPEATLSAFELGQVDELIITATPELLKPVQRPADETRPPLADELVARAHQTAARIRFIEDPNLLAGIGGVGALLRFRI